MLSVAKLKQTVKNILPRPFLIGKPVCQLYINDDLRTTTLTLTQFPSLFSPHSNVDYNYEITFYGMDGKTLGNEFLDLKKYASKQIHIRDLKIASSLPPYGLMSVKLKFSGLNMYTDQHLGVLNPFFYVLYHSLDYSSVVLVHPQSRMNEKSGSNTYWESNMAIPTAKLNALEIFQINPLSQMVDTTLRVCDSKDSSCFFEEKTILQPHAVRRVLVPRDTLKNYEYSSVRLSGMTGQNSKPLVIYHFENKSFGGCHT